MPKRKVTFQGVGNEDDEDEISVPKKKVRRPTTVFWGTVRGNKKELEARRGKALGTKKGLAFPRSQEWVWRIFRLSPDHRAF